MKNSDIQKKFYDNAFGTAHIYKDADFPESSQYLNNRFLDIAIKKDARNVLEIGCGDGLLTFFLLKRSINITAVDISSKAIENMRKQFSGDISSGKLRLVNDNLVDFLEKNREEFDVIIGSGIIHHIEKSDWDKLYSLIYKKLKPGGVFSCAPEPNAGGLYRVCWRFARYFYKLFSIDYDWEVERNTLNMISNKLEFSLKKAGFSNAEILPFQSIPYFHSKFLARLDKSILGKLKGKYAMYIIIKGRKEREAA